MTLDEAIAIADEIGKGDTVRAANNRWLAEKLRILKWVEECHIIDEARRARVEMHRWQTECVRLKDENAKLLELLSMYVTFARTVAPGLCIQSAYADGMGRELDEAEMRECAMELGIEWCR